MAKLKTEQDLSLGSDLFYLLMETCFQHLPYKSTHIIFETMVRLGAKVDYKVKLVHFEH